MSRFRCKRTRPRRGFLMAFVLICLTIAVVVLVAMLQRVVLAQRHTVLRQRQIQSQLVAASAAELAIARLSMDSSYQGETWHISAAQLPGDDPARAEIQVAASSSDQTSSDQTSSDQTSSDQTSSDQTSSDPSSSDPTVIKIVATYPDQLHRSVRIEREFLFSSERDPARRDSHETSTACWIHASRIVGGNCHHRHFGPDAVAGGQCNAGERPTVPMHEQFGEIEPWDAELQYVGRALSSRCD